MTSGKSGKKRTWLIVATAIVVAAIVSAAMTWFLTGPDDEPASAAKPLSSFQPTPKAATATPKQTKTPTPRPSRTATPKPVEASPSPEPIYVPQLQTPPNHYTGPQQIAPPQVETPEASQRDQCPTGQLSARLTSVEFDVPPTASRGNWVDITVTGRGVLTNGTTAPVTIYNDDVPDFLGLDGRGEMEFIEQYGDYDTVSPPPGEPNSGEFILDVGESVTYVAEDTASYETLDKVRYWQADNDGYLLQFDEFLRCGVAFAEPDGSKAIPNTFAG